MSREEGIAAAARTAPDIATHLTLACGMFFWGAMTPALYVLLRTWDPYVLSAIRYGLAVPMMLALLCWAEGWRSIIPSVSLGRLVLLGAIGVAGLSALSTVGLAYSDPVTAVVVQCCSPVLAVFIARFFYRVPVRRGIVLSLCLTMAGALLTLSPKLGVGGAGFRGGEILLLLASACWSWYSLACQHWLKGWSQIRVTALTIVPAAATLWIVYGVAALLGGAHYPIPEGSAPAVMLLIGTTLISTCLGILIWHHGVTRLGVPVASLYVNLQPVFAVLVVMALGIWPSWQQIAGGALVLIGVTQIRFWREAR